MNLEQLNKIIMKSENIYPEEENTKIIINHNGVAYEVNEIAACVCSSVDDLDLNHIIVLTTSP